MRHIASTLLSLLALALAANGATIDGKIEGWPSKLVTPPGSAVVWLEGTPPFIVSKARPVVAQRGGQFVPAFLVVVAGQTVEMPNEDEVAHNVYSVSDTKSFNLGYYAKGEHKSVTFDRPGLVETLCVLHSFMRAKILVVPNPHYAMVARDGSFHLRNVPKGTFTLIFSGVGLTSIRHQITVPSGIKPVTLTISLPNPTARK